MKEYKIESVSHLKRCLEKFKTYTKQPFPIFMAYNKGDVLSTLLPYAEEIARLKKEIRRLKNERV